MRPTIHLQKYLELAREVTASNPCRFILDETNHVVCYFCEDYYLYSDEWEYVSEIEIKGNGYKLSKKGEILEEKIIQLGIGFNGKDVEKFVIVRRTEDILKEWI